MPADADPAPTVVVHSGRPTEAEVTALVAALLAAAEPAAGPAPTTLPARWHPAPHAGARSWPRPPATRPD